MTPRGPAYRRPCRAARFQRRGGGAYRRGDAVNGPAIRRAAAGLHALAAIARSDTSIARLRALGDARCRERQTPPPSAPPDWHHPASTTRTARHRPPTSPSSDNDALVVRLSHLARDDVEATRQAITTPNARRCDMAK